MRAFWPDRRYYDVDFIAPLSQRGTMFDGATRVFRAI